MIRQRISTLLTTASLLLTMTAVSVALPASTLAALANVNSSGGTVPGTTARAATPAQVSPGNVAGFYLWVRNDDTANLNTFSLTAKSNATPLGAYWKRPADTGYTNCTTSGDLKCNFGTLNSGDVLLIVAAFVVPGTPSTSNANCKPSGGNGFGPTTEASWVCADFQFNSGSGNVPGKNKSRGDAYHFYDYAATDVGIDAGAGFPFCNKATPNVACDAGLLTVFNAGHASRTDIQTTKLTAPDGAFNSLHGTTGLAVRDNFAFACPAISGTATCASHEGTGAGGFLGQWSDVDVNSEQSFGTDFIRIDLQMYGVNANSVDGVIHLWSDGTLWHEEVIGTKCPGSSGPATGQTTPCFWASGSGNVADVSIWTHNNGNFRTF
jgi:hypothetical protein